MLEVCGQVFVKSHKVIFDLRILQNIIGPERRHFLWADPFGMLSSTPNSATSSDPNDQQENDIGLETRCPELLLIDEK